MGSARRVYEMPLAAVLLSSGGPKPMENSDTRMPCQRAAAKCPSSWITTTAVSVASPAMGAN